MRGKDIIIGEVYAIGPSGYPNGAVRGLVEENLGCGIWHVRFEEDMIDGGCYRPTDGRPTASWEIVVRDTNVPSRDILALWDKHLTNQAERERILQEDIRRDRLEEATAEGLIQDVRSMLEELGYGTGTPMLDVRNSYFWGDYSGEQNVRRIAIAMPPHVAAALLGVTDQSDEQLVQGSRDLLSKLGCDLGTLGLDIRLDLCEPPRVALSLPLDIAEALLEHFEKPSDANVEALFSSL